MFAPALILLVACGDRSPDRPTGVGAEIGGELSVFPGMAMDGLPGRVTPSPDGVWTAEVRPGGDLVLVRPTSDPRAAGMQQVPVAREVRAEVAFRPDGAELVYAKLNGSTEADLYRVDVPPTGLPQLLVGWPSTEDRPAFSPDGSQLAFVSGRTGIASIWILEADGRARQVTNVGLERVQRPVGGPPPGFVPPPQGPLTWTAAGLVWTADGRRFVVAP